MADKTIKTWKDRQVLAGLFTPPGDGGISLIELAGPGATALLDPLFHSPRGLSASSAQPGHLLYGHLVHGGETLDEIVLECAETGPSPRWVINCHGGVVAAQRVLRALVEAGVAVAPAEALLALRERAGGLDAVQVAAAKAIPGSRTLRAASVLLDQYGGALSESLNRCVRWIGKGAVSDAASVLGRLLATAPYGCALTRPLRVVVAGRPNVGKSTLMNALLRYDRVIVHDAPGTTRDAVEDVFAVAGMPFRLVDTAGLRETENAVEREGVARGLRELAAADVVLFVFDGALPLQPDDEPILAGPPHARALPIVNKADLPQRIDMERLATHFGRPPLRIVATEGRGVEELESALIHACFAHAPEPGDAVVFTSGQAEAIAQARALAEAGDAADAAATLRALLTAAD